MLTCFAKKKSVLIAKAMEGEGDEIGRVRESSLQEGRGSQKPQAGRKDQVARKG